MSAAPANPSSRHSFRLFQRAPASLEEAQQHPPLDIGPDQVLEMDEADWYAKVYRGEDAPQLTWRAVLVGSLLGFLLAFTNLYIGLKTGWALGVAITATIVSYSLWSVLQRVGLSKAPMTILETNCMQSTASSAGYATGGTMVSAIAALLMVSGHHLPWPILVAWTLLLGALGTVLAIPMKRNMINRERLRFPSGTAAAVTLQSLYSKGDEALAKARALFWAALGGAVVPLLIELQIRETVSATGEKVRSALLPAETALFDWLPALGTHTHEGGGQVPNRPSDWTMVLDHNPIMIAAGALVGLKVAIWMTLSGLFLAYVLGPLGQDAVWTNGQGELVAAVTAPGKAWKEIGIWSGVPIMVASGLLMFLLQWRTILRAFQGLGSSAVGGADDQIRRTEVPFSWFAWGVVLSGGGVVWLAHAYFAVPWHYGALAVALTFFLSLVACRATGESDITPVGAMGKVMQLTYGVLIPQNATANLMTASITSSSAGSAADLLNDLKSGYLLGAHPRRQFMAQFIGIFSGTAATVMGFYLLVPDATALMGSTAADGTVIAPRFPAPAAQTWKAVADVFRHGLGNMHPVHREAIFWGLGFGVVLVVLEQVFPKWQKWLPSATGIGLGLILPFQYPLSMLAGAVIAWVWQARSKEGAERYVVPIASGIIAGVSIVGVIVAALNNLLFAS